MITVRSLLEDHRARRADHTFRIWNLVVLSAWMARHRIEV